LPDNRPGPYFLLFTASIPKKAPPGNAQGESKQDKYIYFFSHYCAFFALQCAVKRRFFAAKNSGFGVPLTLHSLRSAQRTLRAPPIPCAQEGFRPPGSLGSLNESKWGNRWPATMIDKFFASQKTYSSKMARRPNQKPCGVFGFRSFAKQNSQDTGVSRR
jgi:hypothetical protein